MEAFRGRGLRVLAIHSSFHKSEDRTADEVKRVVDERKLPFPVGIDARKDGDDATSTILRCKSEDIPLFVLADKKGTVRLTGDHETDEKQVEALIEELLQE